MNSRRTLIYKRLLLTLPLVVGYAAVAAAAQSSTPSKAAVTPHGSSTPAATPPSPALSTNVTVNGRQVQTDSRGQADVKLHNGSAHVKSASGETTITTESSNQLNVTVHSESAGGSSHSRTNISGSTTTQGGNTRSVTSTHVFSSGAARIDINSP